jgi:hypothetical protein
MEVLGFSQDSNYGIRRRRSGSSVGVALSIELLVASKQGFLGIFRFVLRGKVL